MFKHDLPIIFQRLESAGILIAAGTLYLATGYALIWFVIMFLIIDLSAIGYLINTKLGAITYNLGHNYLSALTCALIASVFNSRLLLVFAIVWVCHVAIDRSLGFGLHFTDSFTHTHLGYIGKKTRKS